MKKIALFEKVSLERFMADWKVAYPDDDDIAVEEIYSHIRLPRRATKGSAGYDFFCPADFAFVPDHSVVIPTGIRVRIDEGWVLKCYPRSGLGFRYRIQLDNTVGIIDSDYYYAENEGHIIIKLTNDSKEFKTAETDEGKAFAQGIFVEYGITCDDSADGIRTGGFGSTRS